MECGTKKKSSASYGGRRKKMCDWSPGKFIRSQTVSSKESEFRNVEKVNPRERLKIVRGKKSNLTEVSSKTVRKKVNAKNKEKGGAGGYRG